ncbi:hypothetical protein PROVRUST_06085 [Providencia rustigianii DSM 4541]|uniref:Uncharacterized protein n=1 Tax=Providencia rustigianii DSM 4541 TaxID=500637 RepID=D1P1L4_9GAMM|nr:hypothetical protein PROVRUST_06085 [Providencia rustigianii DSM 4541]
MDRGVTIAVLVVSILIGFSGRGYDTPETRNPERNSMSISGL